MNIVDIIYNPDKFEQSIKSLNSKCNNLEFNVIALIDSFGFFLSPLALKLQKPLILIRKTGKLPYKTKDFEGFSVHIDSITPKMKIIIVDDVKKTGKTIETVKKLIENCEGIVVDCLFLT